MKPARAVNPPRDLVQQSAVADRVCKSNVSEIERKLDYGCQHEPLSGQQER